MLVITLELCINILVEIEGIVSAHPLTCVYDDTDGVSYALCLPTSCMVEGYAVLLIAITLRLLAHFKP